MGIRYLDGPRLRRSLLAASHWVDAGREELNRINVFPVPDGDTGTNFSLTLRAVADALQNLQRPALPAVAATMAEACVLAAHGNSGMLLSQFLVGFREELRDCVHANSRDIARGMRGGADRLAASLDEPVEGTILTVSREAAEAAEDAARDTDNLAVVMKRALERGRSALARTPDLLASLKDAGVVDAGGKAFVLVLEGIVRLMEGKETLVTPDAAGAAPAVAALTTVDPGRDYRFCTEALVRGADLPPSAQIRESLRPFGGSIVVLATDRLVKIHVHTDTPHDVFALAASWGSLEGTKAEDMREQHEALHEDMKRAVGVVVDSTCDLPDELVDKHGLVIVPIQLMDGKRTYLDRIDIQGHEVYERMRTDKDVFTTSQPTPAALIEGLRDAASDANQVLCLTVACELSGTFASARTAAKASGLNGVTVFDSRSVSLGLGMLALRARELADMEWSVADIVSELDRVRDQSGMLLTVDTLENLIRSGRVGRARGWLADLLDLKPILGLDREGRVIPVDRVRGSDALLPRVVRLLDELFTPRPSQLRLGVAHTACPDQAEQVRATLESEFNPFDMLVTEATAALGVHAGPGAWAVFYQIEDDEWQANARSSERRKEEKTG